MIFAIFAALAAASTAPATITSYDPATIVTFLQSQGYKAALDADSEGDPMIRSSAEGVKYEVYFYGCENHKKCESVQFSLGLDFDAGKGPDMAKINDWNADRRFAKAYLDKEKDPYLKMDVMMGESKMPEQVFRSNFEMWTDQVAAFKEHLDW